MIVDLLHAALPPEVRKGSAFPAYPIFDLRPDCASQMLSGRPHLK